MGGKQTTSRETVSTPSPHLNVKWRNAQNAELFLGWGKQWFTEMNFYSEVYNLKSYILLRIVSWNFYEPIITILITFKNSIRASDKYNILNWLIIVNTILLLQAYKTLMKCNVFIVFLFILSLIEYVLIYIIIFK